LKIWLKHRILGDIYGVKRGTRTPDLRLMRPAL